MLSVLQKQKRCDPITTEQPFGLSPLSDLCPAAQTVMPTGKLMTTTVPFAEKPFLDLTFLRPPVHAGTNVLGFSRLWCSYSGPLHFTVFTNAMIGTKTPINGCWEAACWQQLGGCSFFD